VEGPLTALGVVYINVEVPAETSFTMEVEEGWRTLVYNFRRPAGIRERCVEDRSLVVLNVDGGDLRTDGPARALVLSGVPLREPAAWRGPIVMNAWEELAEAFRELERGTFVKRRAQVEDL
jgi:redox-sensitive bicupin YhaK (pirin superfamily)